MCSTVPWEGLRWDAEIIGAPLWFYSLVSWARGWQGGGQARPNNGSGWKERGWVKATNFLFTWTHKERREHIKLQGINPSRNQWAEQGAGWRVKQLSIKRATATPGEWESSARPGRNCLSPGSCSNVCLNLPGLMGAVQRSDSDQTVSRVGSWCWSWGWLHFNLIRKTIQTLGWHLRWL